MGDDLEHAARSRILLLKQGVDQKIFRVQGALSTLFSTDTTLRQRRRRRGRRAMNSRRVVSKKQAPRNYVDSQKNPVDYAEPRSSLSLPPPPPPASSAVAPPPPPANVDRVLMDDIADVVNLVQSLMDRKPNNSFTRRSSVIYTKTPSRDLSRKGIDSRGKSSAKSVPAKSRGDLTEKDQSKIADNDAEGGDGVSLLSLEQDTEELIAMKQQVEDLQNKLLEKDELLKAADDAKNEMNLLKSNHDELRRKVAERDSVVQSTGHDLSDAKIKLADKQAALEKAQWEAMTSNQKVIKLQGEIHSLQTQMSSFTLLFESLSNGDQTFEGEDYEVEPYIMDPLPGIDDIDESEMREMEAATKLYLRAIAIFKEKQDEESLQAAVNARLRLQSFVFKAKSGETKIYNTEGTLD
ncbi:hypothetical protein V2J09_014906 [Rumex salicifolius]